MDRKARDQAIERLTRGLYETMPGAELASDTDLGCGLKVKAWGEVEHTPHYEFCRSIAVAIILNSSATFVSPD